MRELRNPAVLPLLASFTHEKHLWLVTPYYSGGSLQSIMEFASPQMSTGAPYRPSAKHRSYEAHLQCQVVLMCP